MGPLLDISFLVLGGVEWKCHQWYVDDVRDFLVPTVFRPLPCRTSFPLSEYYSLYQILPPPSDAFKFNSITQRNILYTL